VEVCLVQARWRATLNSHGMDPDLLTPILAMNATEGGIDAAFAFVNPDAFVKYLLSLVADPKPAALVGKTLEKVRRQLADRPRTQADLAFAEESEPQLRNLAACYDKHRDARATLVAARTAATHLAAAFQSRIGATEELLAAHDGNIAAAATRRQGARTARDVATFTAAELRRIAAVLRLQAARKWHDLTELDEEAARARLAALAGVEPLAAQQAQQHRIEELAFHLHQQEQGAAPLADRRDSAAAIYYRVLTQELAQLVAAESARATATIAAKGERIAGRAAAREGAASSFRNVGGGGGRGTASRDRASGCRLAPVVAGRCRRS